MCVVSRAICFPGLPSSPQYAHDREAVFTAASTPLLSCANSALSSLDLTAPTYAIYKPRGVLSAASDADSRRRTLTNLMQEAGLSPLRCHVGRLDLETSGLILATADTALQRALLHEAGAAPDDQSELTKCYCLLLAGRHLPGSAALAGLTTPLTHQRGGRQYVSDAAHVRHLRCFQDVAVATEYARIDSEVAPPGDDGRAPLPPPPSFEGWLTEAELQICQGRNRQIRRLCARAGLELRHLRRLSVGPISLGKMRPGDVRPLSLSEKRRLYGACLPRVVEAHARRVSAAEVASGRARRRELRLRWRSSAGGGAPGGAPGESRGSAG